jgi:hypothetical protein
MAAGLDQRVLCLDSKVHASRRLALLPLAGRSRPVQQWVAATGTGWLGTRIAGFRRGSSVSSKRSLARSRR